MQKQLAYMLGRQQIFLELNDEMDEYDDLVEIISNAHLNNNFLALGREVSSWLFGRCVKNSCGLLYVGSLPR